MTLGIAFDNLETGWICSAKQALREKHFLML